MMYYKNNLVKIIFIGLFFLLIVNNSVFSAEGVGGLNITANPAKVEVGKVLIISVTGLKRGDVGIISFGTENKIAASITENIGFDNIKSSAGECNEGNCTFRYVPTLEYIGVWSPLARLTNRTANAITTYEVTAKKPKLVVTPSGSPSCVVKGGDIGFKLTNLVPETEYTIIFIRNADNTKRSYKDRTGKLGIISTELFKSFKVTENDYGDWTARAVDQYLAIESNVVNYRLVEKKEDCASGTKKPADTNSDGGNDSSNSDRNGDNTATGTDKSPSGDNLGIDLKIQDVENIIKGFTCWLIWLASLAIVVFLIFSGFLFMTSQGDPTKVTKARLNITYGIIGIVIIIGVHVIIATVASAVGRNDYSLLTCSERK